MPDMGGLEALEQIMQENPVPVLMVSSLTSEGGEITLRLLNKNHDRGGWNELYPYLEGLQKLEMPQISLMTVKKAIVTLQAFISGKDQMARKIAVCRNHSYEEKVSRPKRNPPEKKLPSQITLKCARKRPSQRTLKKDKVDGNLDDLIIYYKPQVEMYRRFLLGDLRRNPH